MSSIQFLAQIDFTYTLSASVGDVEQGSMGRRRLDSSWRTQQIGYTLALVSCAGRLECPYAYPYQLSTFTARHLRTDPSEHLADAADSKYTAPLR